MKPRTRRVRVLITAACPRYCKGHSPSLQLESHCNMVTERVHPPLATHDAGFAPPKDVDVPAVASAFLDALAAAAAAGNGDAFADLFVPHGHWRDVLAFTREYRTFSGLAKIAKAATVSPGHISEGWPSASHKRISRPDAYICVAAPLFGSGRCGRSGGVGFLPALNSMLMPPGPVSLRQAQEFQAWHTGSRVCPAGARVALPRPLVGARAL